MKIQNTNALETMRISCYLVSFWILSFGSRGAGAAEDSQKQILPTVVWTELNGEAVLPCNISIPPGDKINMVLWFKDTTGIPIYSFDARGVDYVNGVHMPMSYLEKRCTFSMFGEERGSLKLREVVNSDAGQYKCRIDFLNSPTQHFKVNLAIADLPSAPVIETPSGSEVTDIVGPYHEGDPLDLICSVDNGNPTPAVSWWIDDKQLHSSMRETASRVSSHLSVHSIPRSFNGKFVQCRVNVTGVSKIRSETIRLNVFVKPLAVSILNGNNIINDGTSAKFVCNCFGSDPPATVTWLLDREPIRSSAITKIHLNDTTTSMLTIRVDPTFNSKTLFCKCENIEFPGYIVEDRKILQVHYKPSVQIRTRTRYNFNKIKEGDNVTLECVVDANPAINAVQWYHNGKMADEGNKIIYNLRNVSLISGGEYECEAFNKEGQSKSPKLMINVLHAPFCREGSENQTIMTTVYETVMIQCEVETGSANRHVQFFWMLNNTVRIQNGPEDEIQSADKSSILKYTPKTEDDFGMIACWAENDIGPQKTPCYFYLTSANKPSRPKNCVINSTNESLTLSCEPGFDGGLKQFFVLEIHPATNVSGEDVANEINDQLNDQAVDHQSRRTSKAIYRMQKEKPVFDFNLEIVMPYILVLYAMNLKGKSEPVILTQEIKLPSRKTISSEISAAPDTPTLPPIYIAIMALILLIASFVIMTAIILACRSHNVVRHDNVNDLNNFRIAYSDDEDKRVSNYESEF